MIKKLERVIELFIKVFTIGIPRFFYRAKNNNKNFTILSRNCLGGIIYSQYGMKFLSPTINTCFTMNDFNFFCLNLKKYIYGNITEDASNALWYPIGIITPTDKSLPLIKVGFVHYKSFEDGLKKWNERKKRINWNNIYIINSCPYDGEKNEINENVVNEFNKVPYKKVVFTDVSFGFDDEFIIHKSGHSIFCRISKYSWKYPFNEFDLNIFFKKTNCQ